MTANIGDNPTKFTGDPVVNPDFSKIHRVVLKVRLQTVWADLIVCKGK